ncbi:18S rRNA (guanine1575-N7)-methyltransferase [Hanseniaspora osmophila]|uniref:18S rRNA (Guanine(1575)-N(7))-methyltransferase n=1 Tax=Hanseniaspora osmophila TaxID=56408 RepID=A0A1E5RF19_9ASCO|nr:18S rRNA (guanine(1575)-N(7))-methyltransferase [Hanseniaspora osmophila]
MSRPEDLAPPEVFYNESESSKYTTNTRVQHIQAKMTLRALELLNLEKSSFILDVGCGSGLSGEILSEDNHVWCGMDISPDMLQQGLEREVDGDIMLQDMGQGIPFRAGSFDAAISISAIQWLCNADTSYNDPKQRLMRFFNTLFGCLKKNGKFVAQFYPKDDSQTDQILQASKIAGFSGGLVVDNPESKKNRKYYLVLTSGSGSSDINLQGATMDENNANDLKLQRRLKKNKKLQESSKNFIQRKKELMRKRGRNVAKDSKYTGRKRKYRF